MAPSEGAQLRFGVFELDVKNGELRRAGLRLRLQPQPFKVLALLASRAGEVVTREEIQEQIWGNDTFVDFEQGLNFCIKRIRETLGDDAEVPRFIETLPKRGYRFIVPVERIDAAAQRAEPGAAAQAAAAGASPPAASGTPPLAPPAPEPAPVARPRRVQRAMRPVRRALTARIVGWSAALAVLLALLVGLNARRILERLFPHRSIRSLAVLPLRNLSGDPEQKYFAYGMTDTLIGELAKLRAMRVPSFTSVQAYENTTKRLPEIARELDVDAILEGTVLRSGDRVRITVQLLDARRDQHLWGSSYEADLRDILALQHQLARAIANEIKVTLTPQETARLAATHPINQEAFDAYLHGLYYWYKRTSEGFDKSLAYYQRAIQLDPDYALAYAGLAENYALLGSAPNDALRQIGRAHV